MQGALVGKSGEEEEERREAAGRYKSAKKSMSFLRQPPSLCPTYDGCLPPSKAEQIALEAKDDRVCQSVDEIALLTYALPPPVMHQSVAFRRHGTSEQSKSDRHASQMQAGLEAEALRWLSQVPVRISSHDLKGLLGLQGDQMSVRRLQGIGVLWTEQKSTCWNKT